MPTYKITKEVDYVVEAESEKEALRIIDEDTEHPVIMANAGTYCDADRIVRYESIRAKKIVSRTLIWER